MVEQINSLIIEHLRAMRADIGSIKDDIREVKHRLTGLEAAMAGVRRDIVGLYESSMQPTTVCRSELNGSSGVST